MKHVGIFFALIAGLHCSHPPPPMVPGSTTRAIESVRIEAKNGGELDLDFGQLMDRLGHRTGNLVLPPRHFNAFRLAEDKRRIEVFASIHGYFEASVDQPEITEKGAKLAIRWWVEMGPKYRIGELQIVGVPAPLHDSFRAKIPFAPGDDVIVTEYRPLRHELADLLRWHGYSHARVYSRAWVHRDSKTVDWYYFADPGPKTSIASIEVVGNHRLSAAQVIARSGLRVGEPIDTRRRQEARLAILDGGSMVSVVIEADEDIHKGPPELPDSGGVPHIDAEGNLQPRDLPSALNLKISVVEAPRRHLRVEAGTEADPARADVFAGTQLLFRDLGSAGRHLVFDAQVGYGYELGESSEPLGVYGHAKAQLIEANSFDTRFDLRATLALQQMLFPDAAVRELSAGPGLRRSLAHQLHLDLDLLAYQSKEIRALDVDAAERDTLMLAGEESEGIKLVGALVHDARNNAIEATAGHFASAYAELAPAVFEGSSPYYRVTGDVRGFHPLSKKLSLAARGSASWVISDAAPLQARLFGGGAYGFRGYGRQAFSPEAGGVLVGARSLALASVEARVLPDQKLYGLLAFADLGGVSLDENPFADGLSLALGLGVRARSFYIPLAFDLSYRLLDRSSPLSPLSFDPWSFFLRLGEAF